MAQRVLPFRVTIPAGTLETAPAIIPIDLDQWSIEALDLEVPPGPAGQMGFQVLNNGVAWVPYGDGEWLVWDDVRERYYLTDQPTASGWAVSGYNTGAYDHAVILRFHVNPVSVESGPASMPTITIINGTMPASVPTVL